jgi:hypothetical protein
MSIATLTWFVIGACLVYAVAVDENVYVWLVLQTKLLRIWFERQWYRIRYNPGSPWIRYQIHRNAKKLADEMIKENKTR